MGSQIEVCFLKYYSFQILFPDGEEAVFKPAWSRPSRRQGTVFLGLTIVLGADRQRFWFYPHANALG